MQGVQRTKDVSRCLLCVLQATLRKPRLPQATATVLASDRHNAHGLASLENRLVGASRAEMTRTDSPSLEQTPYAWLPK
jgi:hypothetical protein